VRGKEISIEPEEVITAAKNLVSKGIIEITLLGQNVNSYGKDLDKKYEFPELLENVSKIKGLKRLRFMTSHPKDLSNELINVISKNKNIMNHIHLPLQAGSDRILKLMNRKYTKENYLEIIDQIREEIPDCSITTDIIVGFPGEDYKDFEETVNMIEEVRFNKAFTFIFSKRQGTHASMLEDNIPIKEKKKWFSHLLSVQNRISMEENKKLLGKNMEVLVEGPGEKGMMQGRLENNSIVNFESDRKDIEGKLIALNITEARTFYLIGKIVI
jgi:tRNA-2-methylthio-N6-dimethylallyladenosine synthase